MTFMVPPSIHGEYVATVQTGATTLPTRWLLQFLRPSGATGIRTLNLQLAKLLLSLIEL